MRSTSTKSSSKSRSPQAGGFKGPGYYRACCCRCVCRRAVRGAQLRGRRVDIDIRLILWFPGLLRRPAGYLPTRLNRGIEVGVATRAQASATARLYARLLIHLQIGRPTNVCPEIETWRLSTHLADLVLPGWQHAAMVADEAGKGAPACSTLLSA
jgi:hypothetical protein